MLKKLFKSLLKSKKVQDDRRMIVYQIYQNDKLIGIDFTYHIEATLEAAKQAGYTIVY